MTVKAPQEMLFSAYADIERIPEWLPILRTVAVVDAVNRKSSWALRVPRPLFRLARACGFGTLVCWDAEHYIDPPARLWWRSISGVENQGEVCFDAVDGNEDDAATVVKMTMTYTLPDIAAPFVENALAQRFVGRIVTRTMERFKVSLEDEYAQTTEPARAQ